MKTKTTIISAAAVLSTLAISGCGSATDLSGNQGATLTKENFATSVTAATSQARSVHLSGTFTIQGGQKMTMSADESMSGSKALTEAAADMTMTLPSVGAVDIRLVSGVMYINAGELGMPTGSGKPWMKIDLTDASNPLGAAFSKMAGMNPAELMKAFDSISTLTKVGSETVDGIPTTHYKVSVDTAKAGSLMGVPAGSAAGSLPKTISYDVWVDGTNRPVEMSGHMSTASVDLHFSKWGEPVHVVAPPASQVSDFGH